MSEKPGRHEGLGALALVALVVLGILLLMGLIWGLLQSGKPLNHNPAHSGVATVQMPHHLASLSDLGPAPF